MTNATILHMRVEWFAEHYPGEPFHAILCDPPYHLTSITKRFGNPDSAPARGDVYARASRGFMGKRWDGGDIAYRPETWAGLAKHLHPGGFGMAFASSRGWHRLAVAIEDAGLIIHPSIFGWAFGSGFPKATRIDTQVEPDQPVVGSKLGLPGYSAADNGRTNRVVYGGLHNPEGELAIREPQTDLARTWQGHRYGLQALKPALEPIIVFQKPYQGRPVDNITATGAGALNIDGARIATGEKLVRPFVKRNDNEVYGRGLGAGTQLEPAGRWPSNLLLLDDGAAAALDAQSGGGASRFFYRVRAALDAADPVCYTAKASRAEREAGLEGFEKQDNVSEDYGTKRRNHHPTVKPLDLARYLATLLLPPDEYAPRRLLVPFCGSGSEIIGGAFAGWEEIVGIEFTREYVEIARARVRFWQGMIERRPASPPDAILKTCGKMDRAIPDSQMRLPLEIPFLRSAQGGD